MTAAVERFWCPRDGSFSLDAEGFLSDPTATAWGSVRGQPDVVGIAELTARRCLVLLGEPGAGKSTVVAENYPLISGPCSVVGFDLAEYGSEDRITREILDCDEIRAWRTGDGELCLVLDSLDEARARVPHLGAILARAFVSWPCNRLWLRIACRTADWPETLLQALRDVFESIAVVELLPLRRRDAHAIATEFCDPEVFLDAVRRARAVPLASRPLTLRMLARGFGRTGTLPARASDLYAAGVRSLCEEWNPGRREAGLHGALSVDERVSVARRIAAAAAFGGHATVWIGQPGESDSDDMTLDELAGGVEPALNAELPVTVSAAREVIRTGLFTARGSERLGWAHATFADYLAADWVVTNNLSELQARPLFIGPDGRTWPQTRLAAAWAVAIAPEGFSWLALEDPESFHGEVDLPGDALRAAVVDGLFEMAERLTHPLFESFAGLNHPGIANQIRRRLSDADPDRRRLAMEMARDCQVTELHDGLVEIVLNAAAEPEDRVMAGWAVSSLDDETPSAALLTLAVDAAARGDDPLDELKGLGLLASFPHAISASDVFDQLSTPRKRNYHGAYALFLSRFADALEPGDVTVGLQWLERTAGGIADHRMARVANAVIRLAAASTEIDGVVESLARVVIDRSRTFEGLLFQDFESGSDPIPDETARQRLLAAVLDTTTEDEVLDRLGGRLMGHSLDLVRSTDLAWLADRYASSKAQSRPALARLFQWTFDANRLEDVTVALDLPEDHPLYRDLVCEWVNAVPLASAEAEQMRNSWEMIHGPVRPEPEHTDDINDQLTSLLDQFDAGEAVGFWHMTRLLTVEPGDTHYGPEFDPDVVAMPRWATLTDLQRERIIDASDAYLRTCRCEPTRWVHDPTIQFHPAAAGYRALLILLRLAPRRLQELPAATWKEWAPIIIGWRCLANGATWNDKKALLEIANPLVHLELVAALQQLLEVAVATAHRPIVDQEADYLWDDELASGCLRLAAVAPDPPREALVGALARNARAEVRPLLHEWLASTEQERARIELAARVLVDYDLDQSWPVLQEAFDGDHDLAQSALGQTIAVRFGGDIADMPAYLLANLYLWLRSAFDPEEDPEFDEVHAVGTRESLGHWRDNILITLRDAGTPEAVDAIRHIADQLPNQRWLARTVAAAEMALRRTQWESTPVPQLLRLANDAHAVLVHDEADLLAVVLRALGEIQERLTGATPESHLLWDTRSRQPKREDEISDYLAQRLSDLIGERGVVVNREVQIRRASASGIGDRTDLLLDAVTIAAGGRTSILTVPIEVKGAWNDDLMTSLRDQLVDMYMRDLRSSCGAYVVVWPDVESWNEDRNRGRVARLDKAAVQAALEAQAEAVSADGYKVTVRILAMDYLRPAPE